MQWNERALPRVSHDETLSIIQLTNLAACASLTELQGLCVLSSTFTCLKWLNEISQRVLETLCSGEVWRFACVPVLSSQRSRTRENA